MVCAPREWTIRANDSEPLLAQADGSRYRRARRRHGYRGLEPGPAGLARLGFRRQRLRLATPAATNYDLARLPDGIGCRCRTIRLPRAFAPANHRRAV